MRHLRTVIKMTVRGTSKTPRALGLCQATQCRGERIVVAVSLAKASIIAKISYFLRSLLTNSFRDSAIPE